MLLGRMPSSWVRWSSLALVLAVFAASVYRASTQALTLDESITYQLYVAGPPILLLHYDANHHILHSLLCRASAGVFGDSELALRLPSLLGGLVYLWLARRITVGVRADGWAFLACLLLTTNPFVLDYLSLARGYGIALALFFAALVSWVQVLDAADDRPRPGLVLVIGLLQALSLFANLAFSVPLLVLTVSAAGMLLGQRRGAPGTTLWGVIWRLSVPSILVLVALGMPLVNARAHHFYFGSLSLYDCTLSLVTASIDHAGQWTRAYPFVLETTTVVVLVSGLLLGMTASLLLRPAARRPSATEQRRLVCVLAAANVVGSIAVWGALHWLRDVPWPRERTGLALAPCFVLGITLARPLGWRVVKIALAVGLVAVAGRFATQILFAGAATGAYRTWRPDTAAARVHAALRAEVGDRSAPVAVFCAHKLKASLDYYNLRRPSLPPLVLLEGLVEGVRFELTVVNPAFTNVQRDGDQVACELPELGSVRGRVRFEDPVVGVLVLRLDP